MLVVVAAVGQLLVVGREPAFVLVSGPLRLLLTFL